MYHQRDPLDIVLGAVRDAPPTISKAIADDMRPLASRAFLSPYTAWAAVGGVLREHLPDLFKSHPSLIHDLAEKHPGPEIRFESFRFGEVRAVIEN